MSAVEELKAKGNKAFQEKNYLQAISFYSDAIEMDEGNYTLYSNRSGAYCAAEKYRQAEGDARKVIQMKPDWVRGYTRLGAALVGQERFDDAAEAYQKALELDPNNTQIKEDLESAKRQAAGAGASNPMGDIMSPKYIQMLLADPQIQTLIKNDPQLLAKLGQVGKDPAAALQDPALSIVMQKLVQLWAKDKGMNIGGEEAAEAEEPEEKPEPKPAPPPEPKKPEPAPQAAGNNEAEAEKNAGNAAFKEGKFEEALAHYEKAIEIDPANLTYYNNKATALGKLDRHQDAITFMEDAIKKARENKAPYDVVARAYQKIAVSYSALGNLEKAIEALNASLLEKQDPTVRRELKKLQDKLEKQKAREYENPELADKAREEGNNFFRQGQYPKAIDCYTEAIKRAPRNPALYSNRAAAYSKLGEMPSAVKDCEKAIQIDPKFVKAYTRKAYCHFQMKELYKARDAYNEALKIDPNNAEAIDGLQSIDMQMARNRYTAPDEEQIKRNMQDPEIQRILQDPGIQQILREMQENPAAAAKYMQDPAIREAFSKLQMAGIIR